jgi:amiloride-sensitive sodium channel
MSPSFGIEALKLCPDRNETDIVKILKSFHRFEILGFCYDYEQDSSCNIKSSLFEYGLCFTYNIQNYDQIFNQKILSGDFDVYKVNDINLTNIQWTLEDGYFNVIDYVYPVRAEKKNSFNFHSMFYAGDYNYEYCKNVGEGYKAIFHMPNEMPTPFHDYQFVPVRNIKNVFITGKSYKMDKRLQKFPPDTRGCYFEGEKTLKYFKSYTKAHCDYECMTNYTFKHCGCVKFSMPRSSGMRVCDLEDGNCLFHAINSWSEQTISKTSMMPCDCYPPCNNIKYSIENSVDSLYVKTNQS